MDLALISLVTEQAAAFSTLSSLASVQETKKRNTARVVRTQGNLGGDRQE